MDGEERGRSGSGRGGDRREPAGKGGGKSGRRRPIGIDKASRTAGAPPRRGSAATGGKAVARPELPEDAEVDLPKGVLRELQRQTRTGPEQRDVLVAVTIASSALEDEDGATAVPYLAWAKEVAPRSVTIRESLGVALYLTGDYAAALTELQTYRRLGGKPDQNHLIADCLRAVGRGTDRIPELIEEMVSDAPADRVTEGVIVWGSHLADRGELAAGRAVIRRRVEALDAADGDIEEHLLRLWYVAADLAERDGDRDTARTFFERVAASTDGFFDTEERLERLRT